MNASALGSVRLPTADGSDHVKEGGGGGLNEHVTRVGRHLWLINQVEALSGVLESARS